MQAKQEASSNIVILLLCGMATFFDGFDLQLLALAVPSMAATFQVGPEAFAPALAATVAGAAFGAILLAPVADVRGRRPVLIGSMLLIAIPSAVIAGAHSIWLVILMRFPTGIALGAVVPIAIALASENASGRYRHVAVSAVTVASALGAVLASITAPAIETLGGWRLLFVVGATAPVIAAILFYVLGPRTAPVALAAQALRSDHAKPVDRDVHPVRGHAVRQHRDDLVATRSAHRGRLAQGRGPARSGPAGDRRHHG